QLGPAPGSSAGIQFDTIVTVSGLSGLRNAYRSVLSALGSCEISGASRWLEAFAVPGPEPRTTTATATAVASAAARASAIPLTARGLVRGEPESAWMRTSEVTRELAHLSDEAVVALMARSHDVALAELYDRFGRVAWGLALRVLRDDALAEDAVQEAFLTAWRT